jgi:hypothetical protein
MARANSKSGKTVVMIFIFGRAKGFWALKDSSQPARTRLITIGTIGFLDIRERSPSGNRACILKKAGNKINPLESRRILWHDFFPYFP